MTWLNLAGIDSGKSFLHHGTGTIAGKRTVVRMPAVFLGPVECLVQLLNYTILEKRIQI